MSRQGSSVPEDMSKQLCSFNEVMSRPTLYFGKDAEWFPNGDPTQRQIFTESYGTETESTSSSNSCSSRTPPTEVTTNEADALLPKRRRSDSFSSFHSLERIKRQRYGKDTESACESSNRAYASMKETVAKFLQNPYINEAGSSSWNETRMPSKKSLAGELMDPSTEEWAPNVRPRLPPTIAHRSVAPLPTTLLRPTVDLIAGEEELLQRSQSPREECTLPSFALPLWSTNERPDREKILHSPIPQLNEKGHGSASPQHCSDRPMVIQPMFPNFLETRRWKDARSLHGTPITGVLVAGDRHLGPIMKPFDKPCYEERAVDFADIEIIQTVEMRIEESIEDWAKDTESADIRVEMPCYGLSVATMTDKDVKRKRSLSSS